VADPKARIKRLPVDWRRRCASRAGAEDVLLFRERRQYLLAVQDALAGAEAARVVLEEVVRRMGAAERSTSAGGSRGSWR
jgi:hypothetical protein